MYVCFYDVMQAFAHNIFYIWWQFQKGFMVILPHTKYFIWINITRLLVINRLFDLILLVNFITCGCESSALFLAHLAFRPCELLSSLFVRRPSVNISHFNLLLRNHWTNCNQTLVEWSLDGPLSKLCPVIPTSNQDGHQAKNRKKGGWNFNCPLLLYYKPNWAQILTAATWQWVV